MKDGHVLYFQMPSTAPRIQHSCLLLLNEMLVITTSSEYLLYTRHKYTISMVSYLICKALNILDILLKEK